MTNQILARTAALLAISMVVAACASQGKQADTEPVASRGKFGMESCKSEDRVAVDGNAAYAVYFDANGEPVGPGIAEELSGTTGNMMCPTPQPPGTGACPVGYCARPIKGKTYCFRC